MPDAMKPETTTDIFRLPSDRYLTRIAHTKALVRNRTVLDASAPIDA